MRFARRYSSDEIEEGTVWMLMQRIALTPDQIEDYALPSRPAKASDPRTANFDGDGTVEAEALPVDVLLDIVRDSIESFIDTDALAAARVAEESEREILAAISAKPIDRLTAA